MTETEPDTRLSQLDLQVIQSRLTTRTLGRAAGWANELWDSLDSTNNRAAQLLTEGAPEGVVVLAREQTAGRGRHGRNWISPPDSGIYASFILRPTVISRQLPCFTLAAGVAAARAILDCAGIKVGLKWVNDLILAGKKLGGILAEIPGSPAPPPSTGEKRPTGLVIGIGINVSLEEHTLPPELKGQIEWLDHVCNPPVDRNLLVSSLAQHLEDTCSFVEEGRTEEILEEWKKYSVTLGKPIRATSGKSSIDGVAVGLSESGGLIVETADGERIILHAGEVTTRSPDGSYT